MMLKCVLLNGKRLVMFLCRLVLGRCACVTLIVCVERLTLRMCVLWVVSRVS